MVIIKLVKKHKSYMWYRIFIIKGVAERGRTRFRTVLISIRNRAHFKTHDSVIFVIKSLVQCCQISTRIPRYLTILLSYSVLLTFIIRVQTNDYILPAGRCVPPSTICRAGDRRTGWTNRVRRKVALSIYHNLTLYIKNQMVVCLVTFIYLTYNSDINDIPIR